MTKFEYVVHASRSWPPAGRPAPPFGPGVLEILRSCALRACFDVSSGYERRIGFAARIGTAYHRTVESLYRYSLQKGLSVEQVIAEARDRFQRELATVTSEAAARPREQSLPTLPQRAAMAEEAAIAEAVRIYYEVTSFRTYYSPSKQSVAGEPSCLPLESAPTSLPYVEVEVPVQTTDGLIQGRIDRVEVDITGARLYDYKSAFRDDLPGRYERQLQLYAAMWRDTRGTWPTEASVIYPMTGSVRPVDVTPDVCARVEQESRAIIEKVTKSVTAESLASPGPICKVCEYRPWCAPFWRWQANETKPTEALERAELGLEGEVVACDVTNHFLKLTILWRNLEIHLIAPQERFPQLLHLSVGTRVRILDASLFGLRHAPNLKVTEVTEAFVLS